MLGLGISGAALGGALPLMGAHIQWWLNETALDADFARSLYRHNGMEGTDASAFLTVSRSAPALTYAESDGVLVAFAANAARIARRGLLIEGQGTNLVRRSQDFATLWTTNAASVTAAAGTAPDLTTTAAKLTATASNNVHLIQQLGVAVSAAPHTVSIYVKADGYRKVGLRESAITGAWATFDLRGEGGVIQAANASGAVRRMADGWYRISMTYSGTDNEHGYQLLVLDDGYVEGAPLAYSFVGNGVSGVLLWGAQVEQGGFATSHIPTLAAAVTRQADRVTLTGGASDAIKSGTATVLAVTPAQGHPTEAGARIIGTNGPVPLNTAADGQAQNYNGTNFVTATLPFSGRYSSNAVWSVTAWSNTTTVVLANGGSATTVASGMASISSVFIGSSNGANSLNGYVSRLVVWPGVRSLQELTALSALGQTFNPAAIIAWGDSLTSGNQDGSGVSWPSALSALGAGPVYNNGAGGETSSQILARFQAFPSGYGSRTILAMGRNNFSAGATVKADIATAVASLTTSNFLVLGILPAATDSTAQKAAISSLNADLASIYGAKFVSGINVLQAAGNGSSDDNADIAAGAIPRSLRASGDAIHLNAAGYSALANGIRAAMTANGW